jgi:prepilin signal peptidase PulO-like enzyme (type II secretory pathway)
VAALRLDSLAARSPRSGARRRLPVFWAIYQLFKLLTGKEGMGYGDFKLLAALGAWFGVPSTWWPSS